MACYETTLMAMQEIRHETKLPHSHQSQPTWYGELRENRQSGNVNNEALTGQQQQQPSTRAEKQFET